VSIKGKLILLLSGLLGALPLLIYLLLLEVEIRGRGFPFILIFLVGYSITVIYSLKLFLDVRLVLKDIKERIEEISKGNFQDKFLVRKRGEFEELTLAIDSLSSKLKEMTESALDERERMKIILESMTEGVLIVDEEEKIVLFNAALEKMFDLKVDNSLSKYILEVIRNVDLREILSEVISYGESRSKEINLYYPSKRILLVRVTPLTKEEISDLRGEKSLEDKRELTRRSLGAIAIFHDITELRQIDKMRHDFVANVSHELRTPLASLKLMVETLLDGALEDEEASKNFLEKIYLETDRLARLVSDLLDLSKIDSGGLKLNYRQVSLADLVDLVITKLEMNTNLAGLEVKVDIPENLTLYADEDKLSQIMINLLDNAIRFTPRGGSIRVEASQKDKEVTISVSDTGIGIPKEAIPRIFERFYRVDRARSREAGGTGLGLSIVKNLVKAHKGRIEVESEEGQGTKFAIILPNEVSGDDRLKGETYVKTGVDS